MKTDEEIKKLFEQARDGILPDDFSDWKLTNKYGTTVAHEYVKFYNLPDNFNQWNLKSNNGQTVAHIAAIYDHLPSNFEDWDLKNSKGQTVYEIAKTYGHLPKHYSEKNITLEDILKEAVKRNAVYQVQYADYGPNKWTVPFVLTQELANMLLEDFSVRKVRLEFEF